MIQRAEWRRLPGDPTTPLAWWRRELKGNLRIVRNVVAAVVLLFALAFFSGWFDVIILEPLVIGFVTYLGISRRKGRLLPNLSALAPSPAPGECFPVELSIAFDTVPTGRDQGIATFVDGWLHFEGLRTSLSVRPVDITRVKPLADRESFELPGGQHVELKPLGRTQEDRDTFRETLRVWYRFPFDLPRGEPLLPPTQVHPSAAVLPLHTLFLHAVFVVPVVAFFLVFGQWRETSGLLPFLIPAAVFAFRNAANATRELRQIDDHRRQALSAADAMKALRNPARELH
ncbi:hypothetical protein EON82_16440 [bacterium]|nr:MAG: hypothetical protein EON82_16440 [bacterium]